MRCFDSGPPRLYIEIDGTGVPVVAAETIGRPGANDSERDCGREVKLGFVLTQSQCDEDDRPMREKASTS